MAKAKVHKKRDKKGVGDKVNVLELNPWPSYIEVCILSLCYMLAHYMITITILQIVAAVISGQVAQLKG
jgi:hypothetical protein